MARHQLLFIALLGAVAAHQTQSQTALGGDKSPCGRHYGSQGPLIYTPAAEEDRVVELPSWGCLKNGPTLFAGSIELNETFRKSFFYSFVESESPGAAPLLVWLNGGPGCSSIGGGLLSEIGPLFPTTDGRLAANEYSWHKAANLLFFDSPAFVGFSYSEDPADLAMSDESTAEDNLNFLLRWFQRFPHLRGRPLWLAGESFAGHFLPHLTRKILAWNAAAGAGAQWIDLRGFLLGNPLIDGASDNRASVEYWWAHGLISAEVKRGLDGNCDYATFDSTGGSLSASRQGAGAGGTAAAAAASGAQSGGGAGGGAAAAGAASGQSAAAAKKKRERCRQFTAQADAQMAGIDQYDIHADVCLALGWAGPLSPMARLLHVSPFGRSSADQESGSGSGSRGNVIAGGSAGPPDPCLSSAVAAYLNRPEAQRALHANTSGVLPYRWTYCTGRVQYDEHDLFASMLPLVRILAENSGLRLLFFSGDLDSILPTAGTRAWIEGLGLEVEREWRAWRSSTGQVGGFTVDYRGLSFATVRGAGHTAPASQPERALHLFRSWISGRPL